MPLLTRSGRQSKVPLRADQVSTHTSKDGNEACSHPGPKSANANVPRPRPKARPLRRSERSDPLTSSAEEEIFFSNFARHSFVRNKSNDASEDPEAQLSDPDEDNDTQQVEASPRDDSSVLRNESDTGTGNKNQTQRPSNGEYCSPAATNERETTAAPSDSESGNPAATNERETTAAPSNSESGNPAATNEQDETAAQSDGEHGSNIATNNGVNIAVPSLNEPDGHAAVNERRINASPSNAHSVIKTNKRENTAAHRPRRSGARKSYLPSDEGKSVESSGSDSNWAATEEQRKKAERHANPMRSPSPSTEGHQKGKAVAEAEADDNDDDSEGCDEEDKLEDGDETTRKAGRLSKEAILAVHEFGRRVQEEATEIGKQFGKHQQVILTEAGLARKATRKGPFGTSIRPGLKLCCTHPKQAWKAKQAEHYHAHSHKDPKNAALWKQIREHFDHAVATPDDLSSRESCSLMMAVREIFAKSALYWHRTYRIHVAGIVIYPGDEESGRQASGFFAGSDIVKALIDAQRVDAKHMIDEITTILKYKDLEAAQAGGKNINFLPPPAPVANASLLCNGKSDRDRNRMVAPVVISEAFAEAGHVLKTSNSRWMTMLDVLYSTRLCIHDWPAGVQPPGPDFDLKSLSASQLRALVGPYLRIHLSEMYEAELGRDEDEDDSDAEKGKMAKRKGKSKKSNEHRRTKGVVVEVPDVLLSIQGWNPLQLQDLTSYTGEVFEIPLVIDTDGVILRRLKDSEKFIKDLPPHVTCKHIGMIRPETPTSDASAEHSGSEAPRPNLVSHTRGMVPCATSGAPRSNLGATRSNQWASRSAAGASHSAAGAPRSNQFVPRHMDYDNHADYSDPPDDYDNLPPSSPFSPATPRGSNANAAHGQSQYNRLCEDIRHSLASKSDTRKRPRGDYETISEADDIETAVVDDRHWARMRDRTSMDQRSTLGHHHKPIARALSMARAVPNRNAARLPSRSSAAPYTDRSPSRQHGR
ncbi:uncharacterized protein F5147DRAFT_775471 [Suillus discolor]|uniref:Uncharacterized protein n=1 Tax=Suillus discolor TaxID=1912936 RepID=A0A9P7JRY7_9AGAM|nr:uncharacterized protein F5147DRAFT_775471 [Suillus discolor]KAG2104649.1 hypothetical protein F5147DRAFT_775471 [Suillus discolor]